jgi:hypothetical protein
VKEHLEDLSVHLPQSYYIVQLLRGLSRPFQSWAREAHHKDLNALDFDALCIETFNEEQLIKRNEAQSNTNRGSALTVGKERGKSQSTNKSQQDNGKTLRGGASKRWRCRTHKTNSHAWPEGSENPDSKN